MKEFVGETGGRFLYIDDINLLQELSKSLLSIYSEFGNFIFDGCYPDGNKINDGYVIINGRVRELKGQVVDKFPCYIYEKNSYETVDYKNEQSKVGRINYGCAISTSEPLDIIDEVTNKEVGYIKINNDHRFNPTFKNMVIGKYSILSSPSSNKQSINGEVKFNGNVDIIEGLRIHQMLTVGAESSKKFAVRTETDGWTIYLVDGTQRKPIVTSYSNGAVTLFDKTDGQITFKNGEIEILRANIGNVSITGDTILGKQGFIKINSNAGKYVDTEIYDGVNKLPVVSVSGKKEDVEFNKSVLSNKGIKIQDKDNLLSEANFKASVDFIDKDNVKVGGVYHDSGQIVVESEKKNIELKPNKQNGYVNVDGSLRVKGKDVSNMFVDKSDYNKFKETVVNLDGDKTLTDNNFTDEYKQKIDNIKISTIESGNEDGYITAKDAKSYTDRMLDKNKMLKDLVDIDKIETQKIVCSTIGAPHSSQTQGKLKDTGWLLMNHHTGGSIYTLHVKQYGSVVHIVGSINSNNHSSNKVFARLPNEIDPPKYKTTFSVNDMSGNQGNSGIEVGFDANSKELKEVRRSGYKNVTMDINITYII